MTCLRCYGKGVITVDGVKKMCHRCKGRTVVDGEWERDQLMRRAANQRKQVRTISGLVCRLVFWGGTEDDRTIVKYFDGRETKTLTLTKKDIKEIIP